MVCLDTSFLIALIRREASAERKLESYTDKGEALTTTAISAAELFEGAYASSRRAVEAAKVREILGRVELLELSLPVCEIYGKLVNDLRRRGVPIGDLDTLIASAALANRQILVTRNKDHFERVPGLIVEKW